jgi:uncharacterized membrane protein
MVIKKYVGNLAKALLGNSFNDLGGAEQRVIESIAEQTTVSENINTTFSDTLTFGEKVADKIASFGGSWTFISLFFLFIIIWISMNTYWLINDQVFDPYPFILLNLGLSSLAAFQAPIIMMSQNRQAAKERVKQDASFEINLKMELEIMRLHDEMKEMKSILLQNYNV